MTCEVNFDGIVGPTHNYSGLSYGNIASLASSHRISNPKEAALQGLKKMKFLSDLGITQAVLPPHERPHIPTLRALGYKGTDEEIIRTTSREDPECLHACSSAAAMWTANAAIVSPSADTGDGRVHFTVANLASKLHRSIEPETTLVVLKTIFSDSSHFAVHAPIPFFADEGAANHTRFCNAYHDEGLHLFVYGKTGLHDKDYFGKFPPRQTLEAFQAIVRRHCLNPERVIYARQTLEAIEAGVFHNDVISVGNRNLFLYHEQAFENSDQIFALLQARMPTIQLIKVSAQEVPLEDAVSSYLFNSQLLSIKDKKVLLAPKESERTPSVRSFLDRISKELIQEIYFAELHESMLNGGGPACLRLRVVLTQEELQAMHRHVLLTPELFLRLEQWINTHYRDRLSQEDLGDPQLLIENNHALDELTKILKLGSIYPFQRVHI